MSDAVNQPNATVGSVFDLPAKSWNIVKENWIMFAFVNIFSIIGAILAIFPKDDTSNSNELTSSIMPLEGLIRDNLGLTAGIAIAVSLLIAVVSVFFYAMSTSLSVKSVDGKKPDAAELVEAGKKFWLRQLGLFIVIGFIIVVGLILLIVPGIIAIIRLCMAPYIMFDRDLGIIDSIKASNQLASKNMGAVAAAIGLTILIGIGLTILSAIPVIGQLLLVAGTIIFSLILMLRYRELSAKPAVTA